MAVVQLAVPVVIGLGALAVVGGGQGEGSLYLQNGALVWVPPLIVVAAVCAWFFMDNLSVSRSPVREQAVVVRRSHTWIMSYLYIGTFGSFIGYSAGLPLLITTQFPGSGKGASIAFVGPLVGSLARPLGGWLADRIGGARVTLVNFVVMSAAALGVIYCWPTGPSRGPLRRSSRRSACCS